MPRCKELFRIDPVDLRRHPRRNSRVCLARLQFPDFLLQIDSLNKLDSDAFIHYRPAELVGRQSFGVGGGLLVGVVLQVVLVDLVEDGAGKHDFGLLVAIGSQQVPTQEFQQIGLGL